MRSFSAAFLVAVSIWSLGCTGCPVARRVGEETMTTDGRSAHEHTNLLIHEKSPYLLQHAHNPVDWFPWGEEAFEKARTEDRPIFLSIGYSTCHWCHVMERESFEDPAVAALMNETFVNIKVDREERPDIDGIYMDVCQMLTGSGGWPLTVVMTPDGRPFFAGTYFPKQTVPGRIGMMELVPRIGKMWAENREALLVNAGKIVEALSAGAGGAGGETPGESTLALAYEQLRARYDPNRGGFSTSPKFPTPHNLLFLLRQWRRTGEENALEMVENTLQQMRMGGIYDHVGFGFHRYSTDSLWKVPHFEKMLYDQALLAVAYTETFQATGKEEYRRTAEEIFTYVLRDMTAPEGGFRSAEDADSEGVEGKFYLWRSGELREVLGEADAALASAVFSVDEGGNFRDESTGHMDGSNILHLEGPIERHAVEAGLTVDELAARLESIRERLFTEREKRVHPFLDDKILTDWNGLMIAALAKGGRVFDEDEYTDAATKAARFLLENMRKDDGRLLHRYRDGQGGIDGNLDDYAFLVWGLLELYEATFDTGWLDTAVRLKGIQIELFRDEDRGGFFFTADDAEKLLIRKKEIYDGAIPSGNSVACLNLARLARLGNDREMEETAAGILSAFSGEVGSGPSAHTFLMTALDFARGPSYEVVITGERGAEDVARMLRKLRTSFVPNKVVLFRPADEDASELFRLAPFTRNQKPVDGRATAYVCRNYACERPTNDPDRMLETLMSTGSRPGAL